MFYEYERTEFLKWCMQNLFEKKSPSLELIETKRFKKLNGLKNTRIK